MGTDEHDVMDPTQDVMPGGGDLAAGATMDSPAEESMTVRESTLAAWQALQAEGYAVPSVRMTYDRLKVLHGPAGSYPLLAAELKILRQQTPPPEDSADVLAARVQVAECERRLEAYAATMRAAHQALEEANAQVRDLEARALAAEDVSAALKEARRLRWEAKERVEADLPPLLPPLQEAREAASLAVLQAEQERDMLEFNRYAATLKTDSPSFLEDLDRVRAHAVRRLAIVTRMRELAGRLEVPFPLQGGPAPERSMALLILTQLEEVASPPPDWHERRRRPARLGGLAVPDPTTLLTADPACQELTIEDLAAHRGQGEVWLRYHGKKILSLGRHGIKRSLEGQNQAQHGSPFKVSLEELGRLRAGLADFDHEFDIEPPTSDLWKTA